jgi:30S ribosomal protein S31
MGRGDKKTKKGKIFKGSFGKSRPANAVKKNIVPAAKAKADAPVEAPKEKPKKAAKKAAKPTESTEE